MRQSRGVEGFTLVELMVVVLIIGILVAIAIPLFSTASRNARLRTCHSNQRTIEGAIQQYRSTDMSNVWNVAAIIDGTDPLTVGGVFLKEAPHCPAGPQTDYYSVDASGTVDGDAGPGAWHDDQGLDHAHF